MRLSQFMLRALPAAALLALGACSALGVKPWQREVLARPQMALNASPMDAAIDDRLEL
jgi:hypothetical protein